MGVCTTTGGFLRPVFRQRTDNRNAEELAADDYDHKPYEAERQVNAIDLFLDS